MNIQQESIISTCLRSFCKVIFSFLGFFFILFFECAEYFYIHYNCTQIETERASWPTRSFSQHKCRPRRASPGPPVGSHPATHYRGFNSGPLFFVLAICVCVCVFFFGGGSFSLLFFTVGRTVGHCE